ncbi:MAG: hypothetical protein Q8Q51_05155 [Lutibacter sp.]|nr:hypothetical protein [Lutibacter sp.]
MSKSKIRATILDIPGIDRYELIKSAMSRFNTAIEHSFFLEATTLIESLISDRLESRLGELKKEPVSLDTIGNLLNALRKIEPDNVLKEIMNKQINTWCGERNKVIHQAAKIEIGKKKDWKDFLKLAEKTANDGRKIFDDYNKQLKKLRREKFSKEQI